MENNHFDEIYCAYMSEKDVISNENEILTKVYEKK